MRKLKLTMEDNVVYYKDLKDAELPFANFEQSASSGFFFDVNDRFIVNPKYVKTVEEVEE